MQLCGCSCANNPARQWTITCEADARAAQVRGDAFLARVRDSEEEFQRLDFTLREVSSSAPWVKARTRPTPALRCMTPCALLHDRMSAPFRRSVTPFCPWRSMQGLGCMGTAP